MTEQGTAATSDNSLVAPTDSKGPGEPVGFVLDRLLKAAKNGPVYMALVIGGLLAIAPEGIELYGNRLGSPIHLPAGEIVASITGGVALIVLASVVRVYEFRLALRAEVDLKKRYVESEDTRQVLAASTDKEHADKIAAAVKIVTKSGS
jgi:hypothetical protein